VLFIMAHAAAVRAHRMVDLHSIGVAPRVHKRLYQPVVRTCRRCIGGAHTPYDLTTNECARSSPLNHANTQHAPLVHCTARNVRGAAYIGAMSSGAACDGVRRLIDSENSTSMAGRCYEKVLLLRAPIDWHDDPIRSHWHTERSR